VQCASLTCCLTSQVPESEVPAARERILEIVQVRASLERHWQAAVQWQAANYNKNHTPKSYNLHDWVLLSTANIQFRSSKLMPKFIGPFQIEDIIGTQVYKLKLPLLYSRLHPTFYVSLLELYQTRPGKVAGE
jgi:hypothetical protein